MEMNEESRVTLEVVIIGAGPTGLVAAKSLLEQGITNIAVLEETSALGGLWNKQGGAEVGAGVGAGGHASSSSSCREHFPCYIHRHYGDDNSSSSSMVVCEVPCSPQPVYEDLRANFPKDMTSFLGHPFDPAINFFPDAPTIAAYYQSYGKRFAVDTVTRLNTRVVQCTKEGKEDDPKSSKGWKIETVCTHPNQTIADGQTRQTFYSRRLLVCNGHFRKAFCPYLSGMEHFVAKNNKATRGGTISPWLHSSAFDSPSTFQGKSVLIVGGGISGSDIARILVEYGACTRVVVSARSWKAVQSVFLPRLQKKGLIVRPGIDHIDEEGAIHCWHIPQEKRSYYSTSDDAGGLLSSTETPDVILFATGYRYYFPFLENHTAHSRVVRNDGFKMERLYKRIVSVDDPSLAFLGITNQNFSPAIVMEYQARWFAKLLVEHQRMLATTTSTATPPLPVDHRALTPWILSLVPFPTRTTKIDADFQQQQQQQQHKKEREEPEQMLQVVKEIMLAEVASRAKDTTQEALLFQFPSYCNSLARDIGIRGYWSQIVCDRAPLLFQTSLLLLLCAAAPAPQTNTKAATTQRRGGGREVVLVAGGRSLGATRMATILLLGTAAMTLLSTAILGTKVMGKKKK